MTPEQREIARANAQRIVNAGGTDAIDYTVAVGFLSLIAQVEALTVPQGWEQVSHHVSPGGPIMATITTVFKRGAYKLTYEGSMGGESWRLDGPGTKEGA